MKNLIAQDQVLQAGFDPADESGDRCGIVIVSNPGPVSFLEEFQKAELARQTGYIFDFKKEQAERANFIRNHYKSHFENKSFLKLQETFKPFLGAWIDEAQFLPDSFSLCIRDTYINAGQYTHGKLFKDE